MMSVPFELHTVASAEELERVLVFCDGIFADRPGRYSGDSQWLNYFQQQPELFVYAEYNERVIGCVFGLVKPDQNITIAPVAVDAQFRRQGIARALLTEVENRARQLQYTLVALGAVREAEPFYLSCGYQPHLFIQAGPPTTLAELQALNTQYAVAWATDQEADGWIRLMLVTPTIDRQLQAEYDARFPGCSTQTVFTKRL